jgi:ADP-ribosylglycohydrolase
LVGKGRHFTKDEMSWVHAINNVWLTVWGINIGKDDYTKGISETVAMAYDNDCTAATVGSVLGAYLGIEAIDKKG